MDWEKLKNFDALPEPEKIKLRISWLELKVSSIINLLVSLTAMIAGGLAAWLVGYILDTRSAWIETPVFILTWIMVAWRLQVYEFKGAPPTIDC
jgi:hypothetical protein